MHKNISLIRRYKNTFKYYPVPSILTFHIYVSSCIHSSMIFSSLPVQSSVQIPCLEKSDSFNV